MGACVCNPPAALSSLSCDEWRRGMDEPPVPCEPSNTARTPDWSGYAFTVNTRTRSKIKGCKINIDHNMLLL